MTIAEMRETLSMPESAYSDAQVVAAYAALLDDGTPFSLELVEPVTIDQVRQQCRIDDEIEEELIAQKIASAREWVEGFTSRIIAQRTMVEHFAAWGRFLEVIKGPVVSVDAVAFDGIDGEQTYTAAAYSPGAMPMRLFPGPGGWPRLRPGGGITVIYTAGYEPGEVPRRMIEAVLVLVAGMLSKREGGYEASLAAAKSIVNFLRRRTL